MPTRSRGHANWLHRGTYNQLRSVLDYNKGLPLYRYLETLELAAPFLLADYPALSVDRAGGGNPLYAEDTPNQEFLIWCAPIQEFLIRCTPIQEFEFTDSVLVFVRGVIWHQEGYYCYIISQMNTFIINKILPRKCLPLLTACRHLWQLHLVVLKFIQRNDTSRWRSFYCVRKL